MNERTSENAVLQLTVGIALFAAVSAITALLYHVITIVLPQLESTAFTQVLR